METDRTAGGNPHLRRNAPEESVENEEPAPNQIHPRHQYQTPPNSS
jgi:hypothetical protein